MHRFDRFLKIHLGATDRMFRNTVNALQTTQLFDKLGVSFHSINESIDTQSALGKFFFTLMSSIAEMERNIVSERTKIALEHKKKNGYKTGGSIPYGFDLDFHTMKLIPNEQEQSVITMMKNWKEQGLTLQAICENLERYGIKTKQGKGKWLPNTVRRIINGL
ncbi:MAG: recombinase family protein [Deltaproteobacteria bacterium]|nr:recombinase family protein [Deltaproteobacteria bacterium]